MDKSKAIAIIKEACAMFVANLQTHQMVQQAIQVIEKELGLKDQKDKK